MARPSAKEPGLGSTETSQPSVPHGTTPGQSRPDLRNGQIQFVSIWLDKWIHNTRLLSPAAMGAYARLFLEILDQQGPIPDDPRRLKQITGLSRTSWSDVRKELLECRDLHLIDGVWHSDYAADRISHFETRSERSRRNVNKRWGKAEDAP